MSRPSSRSKSRLDRLDRYENIATGGSRHRFRRFKLSSLFLWVALLCVVFAFLGYLGPGFVDKLQAKIQSSGQTIPEASLIETIVPAVIAFALIVGPLVTWVVYKLGHLKGFFVFCGFVCFGLVAIISAMILDIDPLTETRLKHISSAQTAYLILLSCGLLLPVSSLIGWYLSMNTFKKAY